MGSGFKQKELNAVVFCFNAFKRLSMAVYLCKEWPIATNIIVTGWEKHSICNLFFAKEGKRYLEREGIPEHKIIVVPQMETIDTQEDVEASIFEIRQRDWSDREIIVITEAPHWRCRVRRLFKKLAPDLEISFQRSTILVWPGYWVKEAIAGLFMRIFGDRSRAYGSVRKTGKALTRFFRGM
jgi:hypothetical protein